MLSGQLCKQCSQPILASVMGQRAAALGVTGAAGVQMLLFANGLPGWQCPFRHIMGLPCPGCGLSRALYAFVQGDWQTWLTMHAFAPLLLLALVLIACAALLPGPLQRPLTSWVADLEQRTGLTALLLIGLLLYWVVRLAIDPVGFIVLING